MKALEFVEVPEFTRDLHRIANEEALRALQLELLHNPDKGDVIRDSGGPPQGADEVAGAG
ncbi:MAG TPA: hypothetical protein VFV96_05400 [Verrucomicrobiae bacterium]|nr:hypothetical protein [Verrucomicrobiae bacterium]